MSDGGRTLFVTGFPGSLARRVVPMLADAGDARVKVLAGPDDTGAAQEIFDEHENVSVVVGTKISRHSRSDEVLPLQILVRNNSSEIIHIEAANFVLRDEYGIEHPPVPP